MWQQGLTLFAAHILILTVFWGCSPAVAGPPQRVASINLCSDQYLLAIAKPDQAASVTWLAGDKNRSAEAARAAGIPVNHGSAEEIARIAPDLVLADTFSDPNTVTMIRRLGIPVAVLPAPTDFAGIMDRVRRTAALLGNSERGEAVIAEMQATMGPPPPTSDARKPLVAEIEPGFFTEGEGTLIDDAISRSGGLALGRVLGLHGYASLPLERLVSAPIDLIILPAESDGSPSLSAHSLDHPALRDKLTTVPRFSIPAFLTDCPAPASAALVPMIRRALASLRPAG
ncbi:MAG TPA: ABC transporter substrate-binding protein [Alphaproteobacteria bacterium]|nr:ABC transporter substrate-binding protein [Alphaproteobacteria bacterium]